MLRDTDSPAGDNQSRTGTIAAPTPAKPARLLLHVYPSFRTLAPGSVALCGHVKRSPRRFSEPRIDRGPGYEYCVVCVDLNGGL